ncbi:protein O-mannosyl-transferase TMTC1-like [Homarus americanus]|uniref:protein O-mannosyl-transferase TMTC1-like n=1 Tax=Homarus americanus TaxID=6706 RepID=UPI001C491336|nr:protein O-mannosyl-transferase TMTC1-like [Homarus americanus]
MTTLHHNHQAELLYKRALAVSWEAEITESLGKLYLNTGRLEDAETTFSAVLRQHPDTLSSRIYLARVKLQQRSYLESEDLLRQVLDQSPGHQEALFQLSLLYTHTNRTQDALTLAYRAAHNCTRPPRLCAHLHAHHGDLLNDRHSVDEAAQSYQQAVDLEPTLTHAHVNLGALYHTKGDYTRAWKHYLGTRAGSLQHPPAGEHGETTPGAASPAFRQHPSLPQQVLIVVTSDTLSSPRPSSVLLLVDDEGREAGVYVYLRV